LRELRADYWAATHVDSLLLAESLLLVVSEKPMVSEVICAEFSAAAPQNRLTERIEALLGRARGSTSAQFMVLDVVTLGFSSFVCLCPFILESKHFCN
jgi:hypothetical protein